MGCSPGILVRHYIRPADPLAHAQRMEKGEKWAADGDDSAAAAGSGAAPP